jgi:hypothetical protein
MVENDITISKLIAEIHKGDFVRLLNKRGAFEKEGQRFKCKIYLD